MEFFHLVSGNFKSWDSDEAREWFTAARHNFSDPWKLVMQSESEFSQTWHRHSSDLSLVTVPRTYTKVEGNIKAAIASRFGGLKEPESDFIPVRIELDDTDQSVCSRSYLMGLATVGEQIVGSVYWVGGRIGFAVLKGKQSDQFTLWCSNKSWTQVGDFVFGLSSEWGSLGTSVVSVDAMSGDVVVTSSGEGETGAFGDWLDVRGLSVIRAVAPVYGDRGRAGIRIAWANDRGESLGLSGVEWSDLDPDGGGSVSHTAGVPDGAVQGRIQIYLDLSRKGSWFRFNPTKSTLIATEKE